MISKDVATTSETFYSAEISEDVEEGEEDPENPTDGEKAEPIPYQKVTGPYERELFATNLPQFLRDHNTRQSESRRRLASAYDFARFATWWNLEVDKNEELEIQERKPIFRKTSTFLQEYSTKNPEHTNRLATMNQASERGPLA